MGICRNLEIGTKNQKFLENLKSAAFDRILVMTVLFSDMTLTIRKSRVHCCGGQWRSQKIFIRGGFGSGSYGGYLHLVCAVYDVTI